MKAANTSCERNGANMDTATTVAALSTIDSAPKALRMATKTPSSSATLSRNNRLTWLAASSAAPPSPRTEGVI